MSEQRPYRAIRDLIESLGGTMTWRPMGSGGDWVLDLRGRTATVECRDRQVNDLDRLYVSKVHHPATWDDYDHDARLTSDAFWKLVHADFWRLV
jgi:hypothetical protein